jgi:hypothetical protein
LPQLFRDAIRIKQFSANGKKLVAKFQQLPPGSCFWAPLWIGFTGQFFGHSLTDKFIPIARYSAHIRHSKLCRPTFNLCVISKSYHDLTFANSNNVN